MRSLWELVIVRVLSYIIFAAILIGAWQIVNAQSRTVCQAQGEQIVCTTVPQVQVPSGPGFDPSVIGHIGESNQMSPDMVHYLWVKKCIKNGVKNGLTDDEIRAKCFR